MGTKGLLIGTLPDGDGAVSEVECTAYESTGSDFLRASDAAMGIGDVWTMAWWQRRTTTGQSGSVMWHSAEDNDDAGTIQCIQNSNTGLQILLRDDAGTGAFGNVRRLDISNLLTPWSGIEWEHIAIVYNSNAGDADTFFMYYNGVNFDGKTVSLGEGDPRVTVGVVNQPNQTEQNRNMCIGADSEGNNVWEGDIYNFGVWDLELTDADVAHLYNAGAGSQVDLRVNSGAYTQTANLQHYWRFDNGGDRGEDLGVNVTKMNLLEGDSGSHSFSTDECPQGLGEDQVQDMSLDFDGSFFMETATNTHDSGIDASDGSSYTFSFTTWCKFTGPVDAGRNAIMAVRAGAASALDLAFDANSNTDLTCSLVNAAQSVRQFQTWAGVITPNTWHYIVLTWDGTTGTGADAGGSHCYVDGVLVDSGNRTASSNNDGSGFDNASTRDIKIGTQVGGTTNFEGPMFSAGIYNSVLTAADVLELYASGDAQAVDPRVNSGNYSSAGTLVHYYRMGIGRSAYQFGRDYTLLGNRIVVGDGGAVFPGDLTVDIPGAP